MLKTINRKKIQRRRPHDRRTMKEDRWSRVQVLSRRRSLSVYGYKKVCQSKRRSTSRRHGITQNFSRDDTKDPKNGTTSVYGV